MRVLVLSSTYPRWHGDPEPGFVHELSKRLAATFEVAVLAPHAASARVIEVMDGVTVHRYRYAPASLESLVANGGIVGNLKRNVWKWLLLPGFLAAQLFATWNLVRKWQPDVIHVHWVFPQGLALALLVMTGLVQKPFIVTSHGADLFTLKSFPFRQLKRAVFRRAAAVTVVSSVMREELDLLGVRGVRVEVAPMGVDMRGRFTPDSSVPRSRNQLLFVGRLVEKKGLKHLLAIMPQLLSRWPDLILTVVGRGPEEPLLRKQVEDLGIQETVRFVGPRSQSELPALYRGAALFVAPFIEARSGDQEGLGLVTVEAIACGCPALIGSVPAVRDVPVKSVNVSDHEVFAGEIATLLQDVHASAALALQQREACLLRFDWEQVARGYADLLLECSTRRNA